jgi:hypothetical protein
MKKKDKVMRRRSILNDEDIKKVYFWIIFIYLYY